MGTVLFAYFFSVDIISHEVRNMVRQARKISPTNYYHVMMRGNNREKIFLGSKQKQYFLALLEKILIEEPVEITAYCLMDNHVHLVVKGEIDYLTKAIKRLNIRYAMYFNKEDERIGHVFQDRYRSEVILDEPYLLQVIRYVHNNPVKAGIVNHPLDYKWSSYKEYMTVSSNIISTEQKNFIMAFFPASSHLFQEFHLELDNQEYLDTQDDIQHNRIQTAKDLIANYCMAHGIAGGQQILNDQRYLKGLIKELLNATPLSHRQIAGILGISNNIVHKVSLEE